MAARFVQEKGDDTQHQSDPASEESCDDTTGE